MDCCSYIIREEEAYISVYHEQLEISMMSANSEVPVADSKMNPSGQDYKHKEEQSKNGVQRFIILTGGVPIIEY